MPDFIGPEGPLSPARLFAPLLALALALACASAFAPQAPAAPSIGGFDKVAHFHVYGLLATLAFRALPLPFLSPRRWALAWGLAIAMGVCDETIQSFNPARSASWADLLADAAGALLAVVLYRNWRWYRAALEWRLWGARRACQAPESSL